MAFYGRVAALDRRDAGDDVADLADAVRSRRRPRRRNATDAPSISAGSAMSPNSSRWALYLARTSAALAADGNARRRR